MTVTAENWLDHAARPAMRIEVGGWPTTGQSEPWWSPWIPARPGDPPAGPGIDGRLPARPRRGEFECAFQLEGKPKAGLDLGYCGVLTFARSRRDPNLWGLDHQNA